MSYQNKCLQCGDLCKCYNSPKLGGDAIDFTAQMVCSDNQITTINLREHIKGKYGILFFYPLNFTFVCPTEILALNKNIAEFTDRNAEVLAISVDSVHCHLAWKNTDYKKGGIGSLNLSLVSDIKKDISEQYGVLNSDGFSFRGTFIIDPDFKLIYSSMNIDSIGRNVHEYLRILDADTHSKKYGEVCPAGWNSKTKALKPNLEDTAALIMHLVNQ